MSGVQLSMIQALIKLLTPSSPAYGNSLAFQKPVTCKQLMAKLKPGDVIFSRTNSLLYEIARKFMNMNYDHVAVVLNEREVIHISPPLISKIDMEYIMNEKREPWIIRPNVESAEKILTILQGFLGERYNLAAIPKYAFNQFLKKINITKDQPYSLSNLKYSKICSDSILYALCRSSTKLSDVTENWSNKGRFKQLGFFLPDQVAEILLECNSEVIIKSNFQQTYGIQGVIERYQQSKKGVSSFLESAIKKLTGKKSEVQVLNVLKYLMGILAVVKFPALLITPFLKKSINMYDTVAIIFTLIIMIHQYFEFKRVTNNIQARL